jgi:thioredoxin-related protein
MINARSSFFKRNGPAFPGPAAWGARTAAKNVAYSSVLSYHPLNAPNSFLERMHEMRSSMVLTTLFLLVGLVAGCGQKGTPGEKNAPSASGTGSAGMWVPFNEGMARAAKEKKHVVIDFYTSWCRWCAVMDKETFQNRDVRKYLAENFVTIRVDAENRTEKLKYQNEEYTPITLARRFGVRGFPSLAYLDTEGELVTVMPGFMPAETFLPLLQYMHRECYKQRMTFEEFLKKKGECDTTKTL